jgi:hypothetical protein
MRNYISDQFIFKVAATPQATFTAAATDIITSNAHGLTNGDCIWVSSATTLPAGLSASTNYYVISATTNTFKVSTTPDGEAVNITDAGTGTHTYNLKGKAFLIKDFRHIELDLSTSGSANFTLKIQSSEQDNVNFNAAQSTTNRWDYVQIKDLEDGSSIDGDTGIAPAGADDHRHFEVNVNGGTWICAQLTAWSAGKLNLVCNVYND